MFIKHYIFDIGNVMIDFDLIALQKRISQASSVGFDALSKDWNNEDLIRVETGKIDSQTFYSTFSCFLHLKWSYQEWIAQWSRIYTFNTQGRQLFLDLKQENCSVNILSNLASYNVIAISKKFPVFFDPSNNNFFSFHLGFHKPDPRIYQAVCVQLHAKPSECVFIDDSLQNVEGALSVGMNAIQYNSVSFDELRKQVFSFI